LNLKGNFLRAFSQSNQNQIRLTLRPLIAHLCALQFEGHKMKSIVLILSVALFMWGCAKRPDAIAPTAFPAETYANLACQDVNTALVNEQNTLATLSASQNSAANADAVGVFLVGVPIASLTDGDKEGMIAISKGKIQALEATKIRKGC
jgi:hypothetical protein